jgi:integrase
MPVKKQKCWRYTSGPVGYHVTVQERTLGGPVYVYWYDVKIRGRRKRSRGYHVRDAAGELIQAHVNRAQQEANELSTRLMQGDAPTGPVTLGRLFALFRREGFAEHSPHHRLETERQIELWLNYLGADFVVAQFGAREWRAFIRDRRAGRIDPRGRRVDDPAGQKPVRDRVVGKALIVLRQACRLSTRCRVKGGGFVLDTDPTAGLPIPNEKNPRRPAADAERLERLLAVADRVSMYGPDGQRVRSYLRELLTLAADTGRRISSILALRWSDWDAEAQKPYGAISWRAEHDKIGRDWVTPVTPAVRTALEGLRTERQTVGDVQIFADPRHPGRAVTRHQATGWLRRAEELANLEHLRGGAWHMFRRSWASQRKHLSPTDVAYTGGWKDTTTLLKCYQQPDDKTIEQVVLGGRQLRMVR